MPASTAASTVATHSSKVVGPQTIPSPPPPKVKVKPATTARAVACPCRLLFAGRTGSILARLARRRSANRPRLGRLPPAPLPPDSGPRLDRLCPPSLNAGTGGRVAQRESTPFTRVGSQVQSLSRPPAFFVQSG